MNFFWLNFVIIVLHGLEATPSKWNWDPVLKQAVKEATPEFASSLKRRFTNASVSAAMRSVHAQPIPFEDSFIQIDDNQITLINLTMENLPLARMNDINPNLLDKNIKISVDWSNVIIKGFYEITNSSQLDITNSSQLDITNSSQLDTTNSSQLDITNSSQLDITNSSQQGIVAVENTGNIEIKIENIRAEGLVGFEILSGTLKTNNYDLEFSSENNSIKVDYVQIEGNVTGLPINKSIDSSIAKYIKSDLYWNLQQSLRDRLDQVLEDFTVPDIFVDNAEVSEKYIAHSRTLDDLVNKLVDDFLIKIKDYIVQHNYHKISVPNFKTGFSHKFGFITFWGSFEAKKGFVHDLSQMKRTRSFSITTLPDTDDVQLFGSIGFSKLILDYGYYYVQVWNIGPWGDIKAYVGSNSISLKITAELRSLFEPDILLKEVDLHIEHLGNIEVVPTGLGFSLNWLLKKIATWITGYLKKDIANQVESEVRKLIRSYLPLKLP